MTYLSSLDLERMGRAQKQSIDERNGAIMKC